MSPKPFAFAVKMGLAYTVRIRGIDWEELDDAMVSVPLLVPALRPPTAAQT